MGNVLPQLLFVVLLLLPGPAVGGDYVAARSRMVERITADVRETSHALGSAVLDERVMQALGSVPRHEFVAIHLRPLAYRNRPLPIGHGQTISQPYMVAVMTDQLKVGPGQKVLEIGTGSGYQAAILAELATEVYTIEIIEPLGQSAAERLKRLGYTNVRTRVADGYYGWPEAAPFDAIMVTAAASHVPPPLLKQLKPGGRMVIPVGSPFAVQQLLVVQKDAAGLLRTRQLLPVRFVPLTGGEEGR